MSEFDSIAHLDFSLSPDRPEYDDMETFVSLEASRLKILEAFFSHLYTLDCTYGPVNPDDPEQYVDRLRQLGDLMTGQMDDFGLSAGDIVQARAPNLVYPSGFMVEFNAGESVRATFDGLAVYQHYDVAADGQFARRLPFGLNLAVSEPATVTPEGLVKVEGVGDVNPFISLHHNSVDLHRVISPSK
ncbi:MAG: hypothetical protein ABIR91_03025 [Candidatus Saccharimonadales bacterium]